MAAAIYLPLWTVFAAGEALLLAAIAWGAYRRRCVRRRDHRDLIRRIRPYGNG